MARFYRCRVCGTVFEQLNQRGRLPVACPAHRRIAKQLVDKRKKLEITSYGATVRPECCVMAGNRQCPQHRQWKTFKYQWKRITINPEAVQVLTDFTEAFGANGFSITSS